MKKYIFIILSFLTISTTTNAGWWKGDFRLGLSVGANTILEGDIAFSNFAMTTFNVKDYKYSMIQPNIGLYFGMEMMLSNKWSLGFNEYLVYQCEQFSTDLEGTYIDSYGLLKTTTAKATVTSHGWRELLDIYVAYYITPQLSLNLGIGGYYDASLWAKEKTSKSDLKFENDTKDIKFQTYYSLGLSGNLGFTYHITDKWLFNLTAHINALTVYSSADDVKDINKQLEDIWKIPDAKDLTFNYLDYGIGYLRDDARRLSLLATIAFRW